MFTLPACPARAGDEARKEIEALISMVAESGCVFIRNGKEHQAAQAAEHLAMKYRRARGRIGTAEDFIERIASRSSLSGRPYQVRCQGVTEPAAQWLGRALARLRAAPSRNAREAEDRER